MVAGVFAEINGNKNDRIEGGESGIVLIPATVEEETTNVVIEGESDA